MKIYISTPITKIDDATVKKRIQDAEKAIRERGHSSVSPLEICTEEGLTYGQCMGKDLEILIDHCDAVLFTDGYRYSQGCMIELYVAGVCRKKTFFDPEQIPRQE